jgi:ribosomal protein S17E
MYEALKQRVEQRKIERKRDALAGTVVPHIEAMKDNTHCVYLPQTFCTKDDNLLGAFMVTLFRIIKYEVFFIPYIGSYEYSDNKEHTDFVVGLSTGVDDWRLKRPVSITHTDNFYERGRKLFRAQMIVRLFGAHPKLTPKFLQRNNAYFGNDPGERRKVDKTEVPVVPYTKTLFKYFNEVEWAKQLAKLLIYAIRELGVPDNLDGIRDHMIESNIISYQEYVKLYCTRTITLEPSRGRTAALTTERVPSLPGNPPVLSKAEYEFIINLLKPVFKDPDWTSTKPTWIKSILSDGCNRVDQLLTSNFSHRAQLLAAYAAITTRRLRNLRALVPSTLYKRKKDVTREELDTFFKLVDTSAELGREVPRLDPRFSNVLGMYRRTIHDSDQLDEKASIDALKLDIPIPKDDVPAHKVSIDKLDRDCAINQSTIDDLLDDANKDLASACLILRSLQLSLLRS